jgi:hypothetical protein
MTYQITQGKGKEGENCNRTACQTPRSANHFNTVTQAWYCFECACTIEAYAQIDGMSFYPGTVADLVRPLSPADKLKVGRMQLLLEEPGGAE